MKMVNLPIIIQDEEDRMEIQVLTLTFAFDCTVDFAVREIAGDRK